MQSVVPEASSAHSPMAVPEQKTLSQKAGDTEAERHSVLFLRSGDRGSKRFDLTISPLSLSTAPGYVGAGLSAGVFLTGNLLLSLDLDITNPLIALATISTSGDYSRTFIFSETASLNLSYFAYRNLYLKAGVYYLNFNDEYSYNSNSSSGNPNWVDEFFDEKQYGIKVGIGQKWVRRNFTFGCDYLTYFSPFKVTVLRNDKDDAPIYQNIEALRIYLGLAF